MGIWHLVDISIVGVDRVPYRYYQAKLQAERLIQASGLPWTILRATQFHQLVLLVARGLARLPVVPVPAATSFQPIDAAEVADRLTALATGPPAGRVPDMGGPQIRTAADLLRTYLRMAGRRRPVLPVNLPGAVFVGYRQGGHLAPDHAVGHRTWEQFLADHVGHRGRAKSQLGRPQEGEREGAPGRPAQRGRRGTDPWTRRASRIQLAVPPVRHRNPSTPPCHPVSPPAQPGRHGR